MGVGWVRLGFGMPRAPLCPRRACAPGLRAAGCRSGPTARAIRPFRAKVAARATTYHVCTLIDIEHQMAPSRPRASVLLARNRPAAGARH